MTDENVSGKNVVVLCDDHAERVAAGNVCANCPSLGNNETLRRVDMKEFPIWQAVFAMCGLVFAVVSGYYNFSVEAKAQEAVSSHNHAPEVHFEYRKDIDERLNNQDHSITEIQGELRRVNDTLDDARTTQAEVKGDVKELRRGQIEILKLLNQRASQ